MYIGKKSSAQLSLSKVSTLYWHTLPKAIYNWYVYQHLCKKFENEGANQVANQFFHPLLKLLHNVFVIFTTVTRKFPVNSNGRMERLMGNFHCSPTSQFIRTAHKS